MSCSSGRSASGAPGTSPVTRIANSRPPTPVRTTLGARVSPAGREQHRIRDVLDFLDTAPEHRLGRVLVHQPVPRLAGEPGVALVAPERLHDVAVTRDDPHLGHRGPLDGGVGIADGGDVETQVDERRGELVDREAPRRRAQRDEHRGRCRDPEEEPAEHVGRKADAEVQGGERDGDDEDVQRSPGGPHEKRPQRDHERGDHGDVAGGKGGPASRRTWIETPVRS